MNDRVVIVAQLLLSAIFVLGYFAVIAAFLVGMVRVPTDYKEAFMALLGVVTASVVQLFSFWFARARAPDHPPASSGSTS